MPSPLCRWAALAALAALATLAAHPTWARSLGVDVWNLPALQRQMRAIVDERAHLDAANDGLHRRMAVRKAIAAELVAGRITLAEAVARFSAPGVMPPEQMEWARYTLPEKTDEERVARLVINYALDQLAPEDQPAAARRWEDELRQAVALRAGGDR
jgi:hypothetical protein